MLSWDEVCSKIAREKKESVERMEARYWSGLQQTEERNINRAFSSSVEAFGKAKQRFEQLLDKAKASASTDNQPVHQVKAQLR